MKVKIWGARGSIPAPLAPQTVREKIVTALMKIPEIEREDLRLDVISAILANKPYTVDDLIADEQQAVQAKRRQIIEGYLDTLSTLGGSTAGGNTPCIEIRTGDDLFIIDAGSGIRPLGLELMKGAWGRGEGVIHLFFSHPHWDHIQGFPFFRPAFVPGNQIFIYSVHDMEAALRRQQEKVSFPVSLDYMSAQMKFIRIKPDEVCKFGDLQVRCIQNYHPGDSYGYRFKKGDKVFVYASDASYPDEVDLHSHLNFFADADLLIFDSQFTQKESDEKEDWGHSSSFFGVEMAQKANVKNLLLFHYDPTYSDEDLEKILDDTLKFQQNQYPDVTPVNVMIAQEGQTFDLTPTKKTQVQQVPGSQAAILKPTGIFDEHVAAELKEQFNEMVENDQPAQLIIDMSGVEMLQVAGLRALVKLRNDQHGIPMALAGPSMNVQQLIELAGYLDLFAIYPSVHVALNALQARDTMHLPGQVLKDRYKIELKLGDGHLGTVFKAVDMKQEIPIALKILSPSFSDGAIARFLRQARQIVDLIHPNIADVYDCDEDRGISFMAEEFIESKTLQDLMDEYPGQPLPLDVALGITDSITRALEYAHSRDVIHGDLKPKNVLLADKVKISDFGLGRLESGRSLININVPLALVSAEYLAPEQVLGHPIDARTDLYTLGVMMYEMLTGQPLFKGTDQEVLEHHLSKMPPPLRQFNPSISRLLEHFVLKLLDKDPNKRYVSVRQVRHLLNGMSLIRSSEVEDNIYAVEQRPDFVSRQGQLQQLVDLWTETSHSHGQVVLLKGETGIGKTRLMQEFLSCLGEATVLIGDCQEFEGGAAYHPFVSALQSYLNHISAEQISNKAVQVWHELVQLIPEVAQIVPGITLPAVDGESARITLSTLSETISQATAQRPWLLVLDNLQWADPASIKLLNYLAHHAEHVSLMILGLHGDIDPKKHELIATLDSFDKLPNFTAIDLEALTQPEIKEMLENIWLQSVPLDLNIAVYHRTRGNPLFIEEIANGLIDERSVNWQEGRWYFGSVSEIDLPQTVGEAVQRRFELLNRETQTLLNQAAILGPTFHFDDLTEMSTLPVEKILDCLDIALERQFVKAIPSEKKLYFRHTVFQQILYQSMTSMKRRMMHREAGEALERRYGHSKDRANILAHHFFQAGELEKGLTYSIRAATHACSIYANQMALYWYSRALDVMDHLGDDQSIQYQSFEILMARERIYNNLGLRQAQQKDLENLQQLSQLLNEPTKQALTHNRQAAYEHSLNRLSEAETEAQAGLIAAHQAGNLVVESKSLLQLANLAIHRGQFDQARDYLVTAQDHLQKGNNQQTEAKILNGLGTVYKLTGRYSESSTCYQQALAISQLVGDRHGQAIYLSNLSHLLLIKGDYGRAESYQHQALLLNQMIGRRQGEATCLNRLALIYKSLGQYERALQYVQQARHIHKAIEDALGEAADLQILGAIYIEGTQDYAAAHEYIGQALEQTQYLKDKGQEANIWLEFGLAFEGLGDFAKARHAYEQIEFIHTQVHYNRGLLDAQAGLARCLQHEGKIEEAAQKIQTCLEQLPQNELTVKYLVRLYLTAHHILTAAGDSQAAAKVLEQAKSWLRQRAGNIEDPDLRASFLKNVIEHRELLAH